MSRSFVSFAKRFRPFALVRRVNPYPRLLLRLSRATQATDANAPKLVEPSKAALRTRNLIREIVDQLDMSKVPEDMEFISLGAGDPSVYPHLKPADKATEAVLSALVSHQFNSYQPAVGMLTAREALAKINSVNESVRPQCTADDVWLTCGCSQAIEMAMCVLLNPSDDELILLPTPGFPHYQTFCGRHGLHADFYRLKPEDNWEIDIVDLRSKIETHSGKVKAIMVNTPSNPCGSVLSARNLGQMLELCEENDITVISDEIYAGLVFDGEFTSVCEVANGGNVPVLTVGGLSKLYLVPGWRMGWVVAHDTYGGKLRLLRDALFKLTTTIINPCTLIQAALPSILSDTPESYYESLNETICKQSMALTSTFERCVGLKPVKPKGAMYVMVGIDTDELPFKDDLDFANKLLREEALLVLPGSIFGMPNFFRVVTCAPMDVIKEIDTRIRRFCERHARYFR